MGYSNAVSFLQRDFTGPDLASVSPRNAILLQTGDRLAIVFTGNSKTKELMNNYARQFTPKLYHALMVSKIKLNHIYVLDTV